MKKSNLIIVKYVGLAVFLVGLVIFTGLSFVGQYSLNKEDLNKIDQGVVSQIGSRFENELVGETFSSGIAIGAKAITIVEQHNERVEKGEVEGSVIAYPKEHKNLGLQVAQVAAKSPVKDNSWLFFFLTFGLCSIGGIIYFLPNLKLLGPPGIKNDHNYQSSSRNRGWVAWLTFFYLVGFYVILYFYPDIFVNQIYTVNGLKQLIHGSSEVQAGQWFLYGTSYTVVMTVMAIRMYIKYRGNAYQMIRTTSVLFFQIAFAFLIPEILIRLNQPYMDFKNIWPLDYDFFFQWNINAMLEAGTFGWFMLFWGIGLIVIAVPVFVYFFGKRWYCSWVCGCGGLAETLGDPYRHHSDKSLNAWKIERWLIHGVLIFAVIMTIGVVYGWMSQGNYWIDNHTLLYVVGGIFLVGLTIILSGIGDFKRMAIKYKGAIAGVAALVVGLLAWSVMGGRQHVYFVEAETLNSQYGFLIGSVFAGVIGTGFYPIFGNRVWCRFGCPLAAYLGFVQRFKSRFRITTNGGQCISCGNCSTYCEQGIDVRWYAQRGQNIVRSSCVGCGICSAVCPRGVLKLENGPEEGRINADPILIGNDGVMLSPHVQTDMENKREPGQID